MKIIIPFIFILIVLSSCQREVYFENNPISVDDSLGTPNDTTYNLAYDDSILFNSDDGKLHIGSINGSSSRIFIDSFFINTACWSSNKRDIFFMGFPVTGSQANGIYELNLNTNKINRLPINDPSIEDIVPSPDRKFIAYTISSSQGFMVKLFKLENEEISEITNWLTDPNVYHLSWSPDSKKILLGSGYVLNIISHEISKLFDFTGNIYQYSWSPDGSKIAFSGKRPEGWFNIYIYDLNSGNINLLYPNNIYQFGVTWSKDSQKLIFDERGGGVFAKSHLCLVNVNGTEYSVISDTAKNYYNPSWFK